MILNFFLLLKKIFYYIEPFKKRFFFLSFLIFLGSMMETISIGIFIPLIEIFSNSVKINKISNFVKDFGFTFENSYQLFLFVLILIFLIFIFKFIFFVFLNFYKNKLIRNLSRYLSNLVYNSFVSMPFATLTKKNSAELINLTNNASGFSNLVSILISFFTDLSIGMFIIFFLFSIEFYGTLIIFFITIISIIIFWKKTKNKIAKLGTERIIFHQRRIQSLQESYTSLMDIKLTNSSSFFFRDFDKKNFDLLDNERKEQNIQILPKLTFELITILFFVTLMFYFNLTGQEKDIFVKLGIFVVAGAKILPMASRLVNYLQIIKVKVPVIYKIDQELTKNKKSTETYKNNLNIIKEFNSITFDNIGFYYNTKAENKIIFKNLSFSINKGDKLGIVGNSGSGKTTFLNLFTGLIHPTSGIIEIDKIKFDNLKYFKLDGIVGYVNQSPILIDSSIKLNVTLQNFDNIDIKKYKEVLKIVELENLEKDLEKNLNFTIGERGLLLSGGQKQKIGIARMLYLNPSILILDESTNALDLETEKRIIQNIINKYSNLTIIIVTHRKEILVHVNEIFELKNFKLSRLNK